MSVDGLSSATVGVALGKHQLLDIYETVFSTPDLEKVTFEASEETVGALQATTPNLDYLVLEGGPTAVEVLEVLGSEAASLPTLYVDDDPEAAKDAMTSGADVFLHPDNASCLGKRLESLAIGVQVESSATGTAFDRFDDFHYSAYTTLMEGFEDHVYVFDRHGRFVRVNDAKAGFHDLEAADLEGTTDFDHFEADSAMELYVDTMAVVEGYRELDNEAEWVTSEAGERIHVTASKHPIENDHGDVIGLIGISREITQLTKQRMMVERMKEAIEHLYSTYDHNFQNRSQVQIGVVTLLTKAEQHCENLSERSSELSGMVDALEDVAERLEPPGVADTDGAGTGDDENPRTGPARREPSLRELADELRELSDAVTDRTEELSSYVGDARSESQSLTDGFNRLIDDFSDLISIVNTSGEVRECDVGRTAETVFDRPVESDAVTVEADHYKLEMMFEQIRSALGSNGPVKTTEHASGFAMQLPTDLDVPVLKRRFRDQDLREGVDPLLKLRLLAKTQGWVVETDRPERDATVVVFDVEAWKRDADPE